MKKSDLRILVMDDEEAADFTKTYLEDKGYTHVDATSSDVKVISDGTGYDLFIVHMSNDWIVRGEQEPLHGYTSLSGFLRDKKPSMFIIGTSCGEADHDSEAKKLYDVIVSSLTPSDLDVNIQKFMEIEK